MDGGLSAGLASLEEVVAALQAGQQPPEFTNPRHAFVHVVMVRFSWPGQDVAHAPVGAFLTRQAADDYLASRHPQEDVKFYIETRPLIL
jgi:hypothetical protein